MEKRNTIQKQLVLDAVAQLADHPTADEVYACIVKNHPTVSKATVYRNLSSLSEDGILRHVRMPEGANRFDHKMCIRDRLWVRCLTLCGRSTHCPVLPAAVLWNRPQRPSMS